MRRLGLILPAICLALLRPAPAVQAQQTAPAAAVDGSPASSITRLPGDAPAAPGEGEPARFTADATWQIAGYNDQEIVYTIMITSRDSRIIHCNAELHGFYYENGTKRSISDRQGTTVFPGKQVSVGHWLGMDEQSGATYKVTCRPL
jgi:hypothetical protein